MAVEAVSTDQPDVQMRKVLSKQIAIMQWPLPWTSYRIYGATGWVFAGQE